MCDVPTRLLASIMAALVMLSACGGGGADGDGTAQSSVDVVGRRLSEVELIGYADFAVDRLGGAEAFARTWWAIDNGYTVAQLIDYAGHPEADGTLFGVEPVNEPLGLMQAPGAPVSAPVVGAVVLAVAALSITHAAIAGPVGDDGSSPAQSRVFRRTGVTALEAYNATIRRQLGLSEDASQPARLTFVQERAAVVTSAALLGRGYSPEQVIEAIVLGTAAFGMAPNAACVWIDGEAPVGRDLQEDECGPLPEAGPAGDATGSSGDDDVDATPTPTVDPDLREGVEIPDVVVDVEVPDGTFRGRVGEEFIPALGDPDDPAVEAFNEVVVDVRGGYVATTLRVELLGASLGPDCAADRVITLESTQSAPFLNGIAVVPARSRTTVGPATSRRSGVDCSDVGNGETGGDGRIRIAILSEDRLVFSLLASDGSSVFDVAVDRT